MTSCRLLICLLCFFGEHLSVSYAGDDGIVLYNKGRWRNTEIDFKISICGQKIRMDLEGVANGQPVIYLLDVASQSAFQLLPNRKIAQGPFSTNFSSMQGDLTKKVPPLIKTDKADTIAGHIAERYVRTYEDGRTFEVWMTHDINLPSDVLHGMTTFTSQFAREDLHALAEQGAFPLRKVGRLPDGSIWMMNEVIKVERTKLGDEVFEIPADFKRIEARNAESGQKFGSQ